MIMSFRKYPQGFTDIDNQKITKYFGTYYEFRKKKRYREDYIRQYGTTKTIKRQRSLFAKILQEKIKNGSWQTEAI